MTTKQDDDLPTIPVLELLELENNRRFGLLVKSTEQAAQALNRIDVSLARLADASEAFVSLFGSTLGTARTESGDVCGYIRHAVPLGTRGG
jgi:hypothetical protein